MKYKKASSVLFSKDLHTKSTLYFGMSFQNFKGRVLELHSNAKFDVDRFSGPDHSPEFLCTLRLGDGSGTYIAKGGSKKQSEHNAAKKYLETLAHEECPLLVEVSPLVLKTARVPRPNEHWIGLLNAEIRSISPETKQNLPEWIRLCKNKNQLVHCLFFHAGAAPNARIYSHTLNSSPALLELLAELCPSATLLQNVDEIFV